MTPDVRNTAVPSAPDSSSNHKVNAMGASGIGVPSESTALAVVVEALTVVLAARPAIVADELATALSVINSTVTVSP